MRVIIAARRSALARLQAHLVAQSLQHAYPQLDITFHFRESLGDQQLDKPLWQMPEKGVFTEDLRAELAAQSCDLVVHSWKDLPVEENPQTEIVATLPRADARDLLLVREDRWPQIVNSGIISLLTSSPRRTQNLKSFLPSALPAEIHTVNFVPVRGNIPTRVQKMWQQDADGLILAKAALDRLLEADAEEFTETKAELRRALAQCRWMVLPLATNPTAPAQGALAIEIARQRMDLREMLARINCPATFTAVTRERELLRRHGGGCHQAIGVSVLERPYGEITIVRGLDERGNELAELSLQAARPRPAKIERALLWPPQLADNDWFAREPIPAEPPDATIALWLAKADALPSDWPISLRQIVWASGLQTWRRLAERGIWVNGSAESLGEQEAPRLETLAGRALEWRKLSHADSGENGAWPTVATYQLQPHAESPALAGYEYFFWTSGSNFARALMANPWLRDKTHFCGPGNTQAALERAGVAPHVFLDYQQWLAEMSI